MIHTGTPTPTPTSIPTPTHTVAQAPARQATNFAWEDVGATLYEGRNVAVLTWEGGHTATVVLDNDEHSNETVLPNGTRLRLVCSTQGKQRRLSVEYANLGFHPAGQEAGGGEVGEAEVPPLLAEAEGGIQGKVQVLIDQVSQSTPSPKIHLTRP